MQPEPTVICAADLAGLPADRQARLAARRAFVELKGLFMAALAPLDGADWLHERVRQAADPMDLWLLRGPLLAVMADEADAQASLLGELYQAIDDTFPQTLDRGHHLPRLPSLSHLWSQHHAGASPGARA